MRVKLKSLGRIRKRGGEYWLEGMPEGLFEDNEMGPYSKLIDLEEDRRGIARFLEICDEEGISGEVRGKIVEQRHRHKPIRSKRKGESLL